MRIWLPFACLLCSVAVLGGCATNPIVGHGITQSGRYTGNVGVTGNGTVLTIQAGSYVPKLSVVGDACNVTVEDGVTLRKIEFWGNANTVTVPEQLDVQVSSMGTNRVVRRPAGGAPEKTAAPPPPASAPSAR